MAYIGDKDEVVVGIDFGTTYSGVSWASSETDGYIRLIQDWPNPSASNANYDKVPSKISYKDGQVHKWGYEVGPKDEYFRWFKVLLETQSKNTEATDAVKESNTLLQKLNKTPEDVVSDYLRALWDYTKEDIRKRVDDEEWETTYTIRIVLTVPAVWSQLAKSKTYNAALAAGLGNNIQLVAEPEAAAMATLQEKAEAKTLEIGETFVVCDAGGGTVDLISYAVFHTEPLRTKECATGEGDLCGSVYLDLAFKRYVKTLVGESQYESIKPGSRRKMESEFEHGVKRTFSGDPNVPFTVDLFGVEDNEVEGILDDTITLKPSVIQTIFDVVCGQIETLVQNQISRVEEKSLEVKAILLVGGFGESKYLHKRLETSYRSKGLRVMQVNGAWSAICRGATMWGLANSPRNAMNPNGQSPQASRRPLSPDPSLRSSNPPLRPPQMPFRLPPAPLRPPPIPLSDSSTPSYASHSQGISSDFPSSAASVGSRPPSPPVHHRFFRGSYGMAISVPFDAEKHSFQDRSYNKILGIHEAENQMVWLLKRGDEITNGRQVEYEAKFQIEHINRSSTGVRYFNEEFRLHYSGDPVPPKRKDHTVEIVGDCDFAIAENLIYKKGKTVRSKEDNNKCREVQFKVNLVLDSTGVDYKVEFGGQVVGEGGVDYNEVDQCSCPTCLSSLGDRSLPS